MKPVEISLNTARRLAITRQHLTATDHKPTPEMALSMIRDLGCVQIDPIRAVERTQFLVLWSRLGNYDRELLHTLLWDRKSLFEYWAHAASYVLTDNYPIHQYQMNLVRQSKQREPVRQWLKDNDPFRTYILNELHTNGPLTSDQLEDRSTTSWRSTGWTNRQNVKMMLSFLWDEGFVAVGGRKGMSRKWVLSSDLLPQWANHNALPEKQIMEQALEISLRALGVGTKKQMTNHFIRGCYSKVEKTIDNLCAAEKLIPVHIKGLSEFNTEPWFVHQEEYQLLFDLEKGLSWTPNTTLISPFDNLICDRSRTSKLWNFDFTLEIYVPEKKRKYGYYVLPILHKDKLIGRIDSKMDRKTGSYNILNIYHEEDAPLTNQTGHDIAASIMDLADFLGASKIKTPRNIPTGWQKGIKAL